MVICTNTPLPDYSTIFNASKHIFDNFPPHMTLPQFPILPTLQTPIFGTLRKPALEFSIFIQELCSHQLLLTLSSMIKPLVDFLGGALNSILPKIPGLPFNLIDLLTLNVDAMYASVRNTMIHYGTSLWALVPNPMFPNFNIPDLQIVNIIKMTIKGYISDLTGLVTGLIGRVTSILEIGGMPAIPAFPSISQIYAAIASHLQLPNFNINFLIPGFKIPDFPNFTMPSMTDLFSKLPIPGFGTLLAMIPNPLIPTFKMPNIEFMEMMNILYGQLHIMVIQPIMDFINNTLGRFIGFSFPTLCITL